MTKFNLTVINKSTVFLDGVRLERKLRPASCRHIWMNDDYVVKLEWDNKYYMGQCKQENDIWNKISKEDRKFFLPTLYFKETRFWDAVIQPRIKMKVYRKNETLEKFWKNGIAKMVRKYKLEDLESCRLRNWGIWDGHPVIFDYGS